MQQISPLELENIKGGEAVGNLAHEALRHGGKVRGQKVQRTRDLRLVRQRPVAVAVDELGPHAPAVERIRD